MGVSYENCSLEKYHQIKVYPLCVQFSGAFAEVGITEESRQNENYRRCWEMSQ
jgi:hypothetical protein